MTDYQHLAHRYDALTKNVDYKKRADFIAKCLPRGFNEPVLELGCGTGSLSVELARRGFELTGVDRSSEMLAIANKKALEEHYNIAFFEQDITKLRLLGPVGAAVAMLDVFNHLPNINAVQKTFSKLAGYLKSGGLFIFDMNTEYKHRELLGDRSYVFEQTDFVCVWRNRLHERSARVDIMLDLFEKRPDGAYERLSEDFSEYCYTIEKALNNAEFELLKQIDGETYSPITKTTQRILYIAKRK